MGTETRSSQRELSRCGFMPIAGIAGVADSLAGTVARAGGRIGYSAMGLRDAPPPD